jgi:hypothetical protein
MACPVLRTAGTLVVLVVLTALGFGPATPGVTATRSIERMPMNLAQALDQCGFFGGLDKAATVEVRGSIEKNGYAGVFTHPWRALMADDEALAEGAVEEALERWRPAFDALRIALFRATLYYDDDGSMWLKHSTVKSLLVSASEFEEDASGEKSGNAWGLVGARLLNAINEYLRAAGTPEQFYSYLGGNDHTVLVLSPDMFRVLTTHPSIAAKDRPYRRTDQWPDFGAP